MWINLLVLCLIIVFIIDLSGFSIKKPLAKLFTGVSTDNYRLKPFDCSLCTTFWVGLIYILLIGEFTILGIGYVCLLAFLTPVFYTLMNTVKDLLLKGLNKLC